MKRRAHKNTDQRGWHVVKLAIICSLVLISIAQAQTGGRLQWVQQFGTQGSTWDLGEAVAADGNGNVYVAGSLQLGLESDCFSGCHPVAFVSKYDAQGSRLWIRQFSNGAWDRALAVAAYSANVYIAGATRTATGGLDALVINYDASGNEIWARQIAFPVEASVNPGDIANAIYVDATGIYVAGSTEAANRDAFICKYDFSGTVLWTRKFGSDYLDEARFMTGDGSAIYLLGRTFQPSGYLNVFVSKYDLLGNQVWTRLLGNSVEPTGISADSSSIYLTATVGYISSGTDGLVCRYDADGNQVWARRFGTYNSTAEGAFSPRSGSGVYVTGRMPGPSGPVDPEAFIRRYDALGNEIWTRLFGTASPDGGRSVSGDGNALYAVGSTLGAFAGQANSGGSDVFVAKVAELPVVTAAIDIKPREFPNTINLGSGGTVAVAILSSPGFDARTVDAATVTLAGTSVKLRGRGTAMYSYDDINGDGLLDLIVHVSTEALQLNNTDTEANLEGYTTDNKIVRGSDTVRVVI